MVKYSSIAGSEVIRQKATAIAEAAQSVGSVQIRNQGTIGGNVVSAQPAGDVAVSLVAFDAMVKVVSIKEPPWEEKILGLYQGAGISKINPHKEIVTTFKIILPEEGNYGSAFVRLSKRNALSLPILNCAVKVNLIDEIIRDCSIVVSPVSPIPYRANSAEQILIGKKVSEQIINQAANEASLNSYPRDSRFRGSSDYRKEMVKVLVARGLFKALERANATYNAQ